MVFKPLANGSILISAVVWLLLLGISPRSRAETYRIGPDRAHKTLNPVLKKLKPGDVVEIEPGVYRETARLTLSGTRAKPITFRGVGDPRPVFDAQGLETSGRGSVPRGVFQVEGAYLVIEHLEFRNARNGENAAGVRFLDSTEAVLSDCLIHDCDMGIFGGDRATVTIRGCEVSFNGTKGFDGYSHNLYMSGTRVVVRDCHIHDAPFGQNFKSRAHANELWNNWIADSNEGEVGCVDERGQTDRPRSNTLMVGNVVLSRPDRGGDHSKFLLFGSESGAGHDGTLSLFRNTFVAGDSRIHFLTLADAKARAVVAENVFVGSDQILDLSGPHAGIVAGGNRLPRGVKPPEGWTEGPAGPLRFEDGEGAWHSLGPAHTSTSTSTASEADAAGVSR